MNVVFAGTPEFARVALAALHRSGHRVSLVLTQPDRPAGRGLKLQPSAVKQFASEHGLPVCQPQSLRLDGKSPQDAAAAQAALQTARPDVMVVVAYGLILPQWVLDLPRLGCFNIHASLLPRWRGAAPIHRAVQTGDVETGVTIMQMDAGLDTGAMLLTEKTPIQPGDTTGSLHDRLATLGAGLLLQTLELADKGLLKAITQPAEGITYAQKIDKSESSVNWHQDATVVLHHLHALNPAPGASARCGGQNFKLWRAVVLPPGSASLASLAKARPGQITGFGNTAEPGIEVACSAGSALRLTQLQRAGGKRLESVEFLRGNIGPHALKIGDCFEPLG